MDNKAVLNAINHGHVDSLKDYLEGKELQVRCSIVEVWQDVGEPLFYADCEYRVKPEDPKLIYIYKYPRTGQVIARNVLTTSDYYVLMDTISYCPVDRTCQIRKDNE